MNSLKIVILALLLLAVALFGASYQLPLQIEVEQSIVLGASPEKVYPLIENPTEWEKWNAVNTTVDPSMIRLYSGPMIGAGARMQWNGDKVGKGEVVFTESISPQSLTYKQTDSEQADTTNGSFTLEAVEGGYTKLSWKQKAPIKDEPVARLLGVWLKYKRQGEVQKGLNSLKNMLENNAAKPASKRRVASSR